ncbi:MAG: hypothetical protein MUC48_22600 [Leptolyngbya sp. Prado105]|jgi:hypothetical protein|nr:hypothetical protein [Leptolyngbya sp. Prado105]
MKSLFQEPLFSKPLLSQSALFTSLMNAEQAQLSGGYSSANYYAALSIPTALSPAPVGYSSEGCIARDGKGNCVKLQDLLDYLRRTVG